MRQAPGTFTVWYLPIEGGTADKERYRHDIIAHSADNLMAQAQAECPVDMFVKAIIWQHGGSQYIWFKVMGRSEEGCWDLTHRRRAFGN